MSLSNEEFLRAFGWTEFYAQGLKPQENVVVGRVIGEEKNHYRVQYASDRSAVATVSGRLNYNANTRMDYPAVGDFVACTPTGDPERLIIVQLLERRSRFERAAAGTKVERQIIATNVDWVFIATSANEDLNVRRLERYVALALSAGAAPVILLTKADLVEDIDRVVSEIKGQFADVPVHALRALQVDPTELSPYLGVGQTSVIVGSSGVGKSTLVNRLLGRKAMETQAIRDDDGRGRHTTTSRYLFVTPLGGLLIDTPGMRELQLTDESQGLSQQFQDVQDLAATCRFGDCEHRTEPGCAIRAALASGDLDEERWKGFQKLEREIRFQEQRLERAQARSKKK